MTKMIYLACPYSHSDGRVCINRFHVANRVAAALIKQGNLVFSPISHSHPIAQYGLKGDFESWEEFDHRCMDMCDELYVLQLEGWEDSVGIKEEIKYMESKGKEILYIDERHLPDVIRIEFDRGFRLWKVCLSNGVILYHKDKTTLEDWLDSITIS